MPAQLAPHEWYPAADPRVRARVVAVAGEQVRVVECGPDDGRIALLVHGWGCSAFAWRHVLPALGDAGYRAIAIDLRGHGLSDKPPDEDAYTTASLVRQVAQLREALGIGRAALVAHSMGAVIARELAFAEPQRVSHLVLLSPAGFGRIHRAEMGRLFSPRLLAPMLPMVVTRGAVARSMAHTWGDRTSPTEQEVDDYWAPTQFREFVMASRHLLHRFDWAPPDPARWAAPGLPPVLTILGTHERLIDLTATEVYIARHVRRARIEVIEGAGHALQEDSPDEVNPLLVEFLRG